MSAQDIAAAACFCFIPWWIGFGMAWDIIGSSYRKERIAELQRRIDGHDTVFHIVIEEDPR